MAGPTTPEKRRKAIRKEESIRLRCTTQQKEILEKAAERAGLGLSGWMLMIGLREAQLRAPVADGPVVSRSSDAGDAG